MSRRKRRPTAFNKGLRRWDRSRQESDPMEEHRDMQTDFDNPSKDRKGKFLTRYLALGND